MRSLRVLVALGLLLGATLPNCGGQSSQTDDGDDGDSGAVGGEAGVGAGGSTGVGGDATSGGSAGSSAGDGGGPADGGSAGDVPSGGTSAGGAAGEAPDPDAFCRLPYVQGPCRAAQRVYWFDASTGLCLPFTYGGCEGNDNRFSTIEECYQTCGGRGDGDAAACTDTGDCIARRLGEPCCTTDVRDFVALRRDADFSCDDPALGCRACAADCATAPQDGYIGSYCESGRCVLYDVRERGGNACEPEYGCQLHYGADCCVECDPEKYPTMLIATDESFDFPECNITCVRQEPCDYAGYGYSAVCSETTGCEVVSSAP